jgi:hypothetical protein
LAILAPTDFSGNNKEGAEKRQYEQNNVNTSEFMNKYDESFLFWVIKPAIIAGN